MSLDHFQGKSTLEHLKEVREKTAEEVHGSDLPGHLAAALDAAKETAFILLILWVTLMQFPMEPHQIILILFFVSFGTILWKTGRNSLIGYARLERLHRVTEQERWEIEHHRQQEKEELTEMYRLKGLSGKLLDEVIDVLMADDNRLLHIMLEEELGLTLEAYEHPLKQGIGACLGSMIAAALILFGFFINIYHGVSFACILIIGLSSIIVAKKQGNRAVHAFIWNLALLGLAAGATYFLTRFVFN